MKKRSFAALLLVAVLICQAFGQGQSDLDRLDKKLSRYFEKAMPGWKHDRVEPLMGSGNVLIQFWSRSNRRVKISVILHQTGSEAREVIERNARYTLNKEALTDLGDEAHAGGYGSADVAFRKGKLTIYISTSADVDSDPDARNLSQEQRFDREKSEMRRLSREFARQTSNAVEEP